VIGAQIKKLSYVTVTTMSTLSPNGASQRKLHFATFCSFELLHITVKFQENLSIRLGSAHISWGQSDPLGHFRVNIFLLHIASFVLINIS
jgi:hypothetical protein